tara:strand:+ start:5337 stop:6089 length:753 start_codon:yes stop_codon:yes gene_type:complete
MNYLIAANWKMNASKQFIRSYLSNLNFEENINVKMLICPPDCYLDEVNSKTNLAILKGAQNISFEEDGAFTGEVSAKMLNDLNVEYTIVGHSERRQYHNETNEIVAKKFNIAIKNNIKPILCVGETLEQRKTGETFDHIKNQLLTVLTNDLINRDSEFIVAYEPIWAIGTGETATPEIANEAHLFIDEILNEIGLSDNNILIIYGGSVNSKNAFDLFNMSHISGALIGGASLDVNEFIKIYNIAEEIRNE